MNEVILVKDVALLVESSKEVMVVQNTMKGTDSKLYVSAQNDPALKWIEIDSGESVKFGDPMYLMQKSWDQWVFPAIEHD